MNRMKNLLREMLSERTYKWNEMLDAAVKTYAGRYPDDAGDANDLKGRFGSAFSLMEDDREVLFEAGVCALFRPNEKSEADKEKNDKSKADKEKNEKAKGAKEEAEKQTKKPAEKRSGKRSEKTAKSEKAEADKKSAKAVPAESPAAKEEKTEGTAETKLPATAKRTGKAAAKPAKSETQATGETAKEVGEKKETPVVGEEKAAPKKRGRKSKAEAVKEEKPSLPVEAEKTESVPKEENARKEESPATEPSAPKKRGRKPKAQVAPVAKKEESASEEAGKATEKAVEAEKTKKETGSVAASEKSAEQTAEQSKEKPAEQTAEQTAGKTDEQPAKTEKAESTVAEQTAVATEKKPEPAAERAPVFDMTLLFGGSSKSGAQTSRREEKTAKAERNEKTEKVEKAEKSAGTEIAGKAEKSGEKGESLSEKREKDAEKALIERPAGALVEAGENRKRQALPEFAFLGNAGAKKEGNGSDASRKEARAEKGEQAIAAQTNRGAAETVARQPVKKAESAAQPTPVRAQTVNPTAQTAQTKGTAGVAESGNGGRRERRGGRNRSAAPLTAEDALKNEFLKKLRLLGGDYFEYYSVYLLERYSMKNGRRLEGLKVSGGERDGGIDGEITLTDKFGFRETIYIQAKNWDPSKGDQEKWIVGETLLQQFIGAVACRQAQEGAQSSRGVFMTTSRFTEGAKRLLETMSERFVGYDADDVFEAAKECSFGLRQVNGEWTIDEELLSGGKAFFNMM